MGVQNLWQILAPVKSTESIDMLKGRTFAVDLAIWLVESQVTGVKMMQGRVIKPHLRNLFFRVSNFLQLGVKLVFVVDGTPPELKWEEIARRNDARLGGGARGGWRGRDRRRGGGGVKKASRSHFTSWLKECQELLELMGLPCIQSKGEAEAMCAALNSAGMVDGCITEDGDAFLYGAQVVYRNLNMATGKVDRYSMDDIKSDLNLDRRRLIALAILLGCDYLPKGVPGIGKEVAMRFMNSLPSTADPLKLFQTWRGGCDSDCQTSEERGVKKKCLRVEGFPNLEVIKEFLQNKEKPPTHHMEWRRPLLLHIQQFNLVKMEWPIEYTQEKVVPLMTLYDLTHLTSDPKGRLHPATVVKLRVRQGIQCVEVKWHKPEENKENDEDSDPFYTTVEERERFTSVYPKMMQEFVVAMETKKAKGEGKKKQNVPTSSPQDGSMADDHLVAMDTASQHASDTDVPVTFDLQLPLKANPEPTQIPSCPGSKLEGREVNSDSDDEMMKKLISLSLCDGATGDKEVGRGRGRGGDDGKGQPKCQKDDTRQKSTHNQEKRMQNREKKSKQQKERPKGMDNTSRNSSSDGLNQEELSSMKYRVEAEPAISLGTEEILKTKPDIHHVVEDIGTEGSERQKEVEEESFIEVLPLSQRLGSRSLRGFISKSQRIGKCGSGSASRNAEKYFSHSSSDDELEEGICETPQFHNKSSSVTVRSGLTRSTEITDRDLTKYSSISCAGSPQPCIDAAEKIERECSPGGSIDQSQAGFREALQVMSPHGFKDKLKSTPECRQDTKVSNYHTPPHTSNFTTSEVIDLTEDSPLNDRRISPVYPSEVAACTAHQAPSAISLGIKTTSLEESELDDESAYSGEDVTSCQEKPMNKTLSVKTIGHEQSRCSVGQNESCFMKLDNSLAKFMNELSLVSKPATSVESFVEGDDSVFVIEDGECRLEDGQVSTNLEEIGEEKIKGLNTSHQCTVQRQSSKCKGSLPVLEGTDLGCQEEVNVKVLQSKYTKTEEIVDIPKDQGQGRPDNYVVSSEDSRLLIEFKLGSENLEKNVDKKIGHTEIGNISVSKPQGKIREKSSNGRVRKTKKKRKAMTRHSLLIENDLLKILQTMSPGTGLSSSSEQLETVLSSEAAQVIRDPSSYSSRIDSKQESPGSSGIALSSCSSPSMTQSSATSLSESLSTLTPNLPRPLATVNSERSTLTVTGEQQTGEPQATIANSSQGVHMDSPSTKSSSHLLREQLLSMLSQLTPGDSPLVGTKVIRKSQYLRPSCIRTQKFNGVGMQQVFKDDPTCKTRDILKTSTQHNCFQQISTTKINEKCECDSVDLNVSVEETKSSPRLCKGDKCKPKSTQGSHLLIAEHVSHKVGKPRTEIKPRSHSQPSTGLGVPTKRNRSILRSCSQPVKSRTKSRSKTSLKGSRKRESMLRMECNLAKILEGLSSPL